MFSLVCGGSAGVLEVGSAAQGDGGRMEIGQHDASTGPHDTGQLLVGDQPVRFSTPAEAVDCGIGYLPRERRTEGLVLFLSVAANITSITNFCAVTDDGSHGADVNTSNNTFSLTTPICTQNPDLMITKIINGNPNCVTLGPCVMCVTSDSMRNWRSVSTIWLAFARSYIID